VRISSKKRTYLFVLLAIFFAFVCTRSTVIGFVSPIRVIANIFTAVKLTLAKFLQWSMYDNRLNIIDAHPYYLETLTRLQGALLAIALGSVLSVSGAAYQAVFRNPISTPAMLGVSSGIQAANLMLVIQFSASAITMTTTRFIYGYVFGLSLLCIVLIISRLMGKKRSSTIDILLVGSIVTRLCGHVINAIQTSVMTDDDYLIYQQMNLYGTGVGNYKGVIFLVAALAVGMLPLFLLRFSLNASSFEEGRSLGVNTKLLRVLALVFSTILMIAAQIHLGDVALLTLLVPHLCRYLFGSDLRSLIPGCIVLGAIVMLVCRIIVTYCWFNPYLQTLAVSTIVNVLAMPLMILVVFKQRRGWE